MKVRIPTQLRRLLTKTLLHFIQSKENVQRFVNMTNWIKGRYGDRYVFQTSHGTQQMKRYEPKKYKNDVNTPLRIRARNIMHLAVENPYPSIKEKLRELYRTYPFNLLKDKGETIQLKNFYFVKRTRDKDEIKIYKVAQELVGLEGLSNNCPSLYHFLSPEDDELYWEGNYKNNKGVDFAYSGEEEEWYYAVNVRNNDMSNVLRFIWQD